MKHALSLHDYYKSQSDQWPLYHQWASLIETERSPFFPTKKMVLTDCPGGQSPKHSVACEKMGFQYHRCLRCQSLFVCPRPSASSLQKFYTSSKAMKYWRKNIIAAHPTSRMRYQASPLTQWLSSTIHKYLASKKSLNAIDYKPGSVTAWDIDGLSTSGIHLTIIDPLHTSAKHNGHTRNVSNIQQVKRVADVVTAFGVIEREFDPLTSLQTIANNCRRGGLLLLTTNTMSGFEFQLLQEHSHRIVPPYRLNVLTIPAIKLLLQQAGFSILHVSTPGKLDAEIVARTIKGAPRIVDQFFHSLFENLDNRGLQSFQDFLQLNTLSSHVRITARKR